VGHYFLSNPRIIKKESPIFPRYKKDDLNTSRFNSAPNIRVYYQWGFNTDHSDLEFSAAFLKCILEMFIELCLNVKAIPTSRSPSNNL
jgi:hypothetical protein